MWNLKVNECLYQNRNRQILRTVVTSGESEGGTRKGYEIKKYKLLVKEDEMVGWHHQHNGHESE